MMDEKKRILEEQDHPLKNTDDAFVQVGRDGEAVVPRSAEEQDRGGERDGKKPVVYDRP